MDRRSFCAFVRVLERRGSINTKITNPVVKGFASIPLWLRIGVIRAQFYPLMLEDGSSYKIEWHREIGPWARDHYYCTQYDVKGPLMEVCNTEKIQELYRTPANKNIELQPAEARIILDKLIEVKWSRRGLGLNNFLAITYKNVVIENVVVEKLIGRRICLSNKIEYCIIGRSSEYRDYIFCD